MASIPIGAQGTFTALVTSADLANNFKDASLPAVLSTPVMIKMMENAALSAIRPLFDPGESAVGTAIAVRHLAATPVGRNVVAHAQVTHVEGRRIEFAVSAHDGEREIGSGTHERVVIDLERYTQRLKQQEP